MWTFSHEVHEAPAGLQNTKRRLSREANRSPMFSFLRWFRIWARCECEVRGALISRAGRAGKQKRTIYSPGKSVSFCYFRYLRAITFGKKNNVTHPPSPRQDVGLQSCLREGGFVFYIRGMFPEKQRAPRPKITCSFVLLRSGSRIKIWKSFLLLSAWS